MNVLLTRPYDASDTLAQTLRHAGATVTWRPTIEIDLAIQTPELDRALVAIESFEWLVFTSTNAVSSVWRRARALGIPLEQVRSRLVAAVGPATEGALAGLDIDVQLTATPHTAEGLIAGLAPLAARSHFLYPRAARVLPTLVDGLRQLGAHVTDVTAYETRPVTLGADFAHALSKSDCVVFCSPSAIHAALAFKASLATRAVACIGHTTANAARSAGLPVAIIPEQPTAGALADALLNHFVAH